MARKIQSLSFGATDANPYEPVHKKVAVGHREHRSKKGRHYIVRKDRVDDYKKKVEELRLKDLEENE